MSRIRYILALTLLVGLTATHARAVILYSNQISTGGVFNGQAGVANIIMDDVEIDSSIHNPDQAPLAITRVTFGIIRLANAPAINITGYYGATTNGADPQIDFPTVEAPISSFGSVSLPAYGGASPALELVTIGDGVNTLFTVNPNFDDPFAAGYGEIAVGLAFSSIDNFNYWALAEYNDGVSPFNFPDFFFGTPDASTTATAQSLSGQDNVFHLQIEGAPVPEPASAGLVALGMVAAMIRRRAN